MIKNEISVSIVMPCKPNCPPRAARLFPEEGARVEPGDSRNYMIVPQTMFRVLGQYFEGITYHALNGAHGVGSADNVRWLQRACGHPTTGVMDGETWSMLSRLYELTVVEHRTGEGSEVGWG